MNYKNILFLLPFLFIGPFIQNGFAQCPEIEFIMANACDDASNAESDSEFMILNSGAGFDLDDLTIDYDTNNNGAAGSVNSDVGPSSTCGFMFPFGAQLQNMGVPPPCPNVTLVGPGQSIPANVLVVVFTSSVTTGDTYDWTPLCGAGQQVYLIQSDCNRDIGAFTDGTGASSPRTTIISLPGPPACNDVLTYDRMDLVGGDGGYVMDDGAGGLTYGNGCAPPPIPLPCTPPGFTNPGPQTVCGSYELPIIMGTDLTGNQFYSDMPNGGGTVYLEGSTVSVNTTIYMFDPTETCENPSFTITINPLPTANPPSDLLFCVTVIPPAIISHNINAVETEITGGDGTLTVSWYSDAAGNSPIANIATTVLSMLPPPISFIAYATVTDGNTCESTTVPVTINAEEPPTAISASDEVCDDGTGMHTFDLTDYANDINGGTGNVVTYYSDAGGTVVIADPTMFIVNAPSGIAYVRVDSPNGCPSDVALINLTISPAPDWSTIDFTVSPLEACNTANVDLTFTLPTAGTYDITIEAVIAGVGTQSEVLSVMDGVPIAFPVAITGTTVFTITNIAGGPCPGTGTSNAAHTVTIFQQPDITPIADVDECDSYTLLPITVTNPTGSVSYWTGPGGTGTQYFPGDVLTFSQIPMYAYDSAALGCADEEEFDIVITPQPVIDPIADEEACVSFVLPGVIGTNLVNPTYYTQPDGGGTEMPIGTTIGANTTLYAFAGSFPDCYAQEMFEVTITFPPMIDVINDVPACGSYILPDFTGTDLSVDHTYYTQPNGGGFQLPIGTNVTSSVTLYAFDGTVPSCFDEEEFSITITPQPAIDNIDDGTYCGSYTLPDFTGTNLTAGHTYYTQINGGGSEVTIGTSITSTATLYAFEGTFPDCYAQEMFQITITPIPDLVFSGNNSICNGNEIDLSTLVSDAANTGHTITFHSGSPAAPGNELPSTLVMPNASTSYYAYIDGGTNICQVELEVPIIVNPTPSAQSSSLDACDNGQGEAIFVLTDLDNFIGVGSGFPVIWYFDEDANFTIGNASNFVSPTTTVYAIVDNGVCLSSIVEIDLTVISSFTIDIIEDMSIQCFGDGGAMVSVEIIGGTPNYSYDWSDNSNDGNPTPTFGVGTYSLTVTDESGCKADDMITISQPDELIISCGEQMAATGVGDDGQAFVQIMGGTSDYIISWSGPESGNMTENATGTFYIINLMSGDYNVVVTDENDCTANCSFSIGNPACPIALTIEGTNPLCEGDTLGSIALMVTDGIDPITYDWNFDEYDGMGDLSNLGVGTYEVTVTGDDGCSKTTSVTLTTPEALSMTCTQGEHPSTVGGTDGQMTIVFSGGTANYTVEWTGPVSGTEVESSTGTFTINDLPMGDYDVLITDMNGCTADCAFEITDPDCNISISSSSTAPICNGEMNGSIDLVISGASGNVAFDWDDDSLDGMEDPFGLGAGNYSVTVTDGLLCFDTMTIMVTEPDSLTISCGQSSQVTTPGGSDGVATMSFEGGTAPYVVSWTGVLGATGMESVALEGMITVTDLSADDYTVVVTDANDCMVSCNFTITEVVPGCMMTLAITNELNKCFGDTLGTIDLTITDAVGVITIDWNVDELDGIEDPVNLVAGTYSVTVTDANNCVEIISTTLVDPEEFTISCEETIPVSNQGGSNGVGVVTYEGGAAPYYISWSDSSGVIGMDTLAFEGMFAMTSLSAGMYAVVVTDENGCTLDCDFIITEPTPGCDMVLTINSDPNMCFGDSLGTIDLDIMDAVGATTIDWNIDNLDGIEDPINLPAGIYSVTVTDDNNCVKSVITAIVDPEEFIISCEETIPVSNQGGSNGVGVVTYEGGAAPYYINWSDTSGVIGMDTLAFEGMFAMTNLSAGMYTVVVTDENGCTLDCDFIITEPVPNCDMVLTINSDPNMCFGDSLGTIDLTITDAVGIPTIDWNVDNLDGIEDPVNLIAGIYSVTVTDADNCTQMIFITVDQPELLTLDCSVISSISIPGAGDGEAGLMIAGGTSPYQIIWSGVASGVQQELNPGLASIDGLVAGNYTVTVVDVNNCEETCQFNILDAGCTMVVNVIPTSENCPDAFDGSILLEISGGTDPITIEWNDGSLDGQSNPMGLSAGDYSVTITDVNDCQIIENITLTTLNPNPEVTVSATTIAVCSHDCVDINIHFEGTPPFIGEATVLEAGTTILLTSFSQDTTYSLCPSDFGLSSGTLTVQVTEVSDLFCTQTVDITEQIQILEPTAFLLEETLCPGDFLLVNGETYNETNLTGTEVLLGASANGCDSTVTINLNYLPAVTASLLEDKTICDGESTRLTIQISEAGLYDVTFSDGINLPIVYNNVTNGFTIEVFPTETMSYFIHNVEGVGQNCPVLIEIDQVTVTVSQIQALVQVVVPISCGEIDGGVVGATGSLGVLPYTYTWTTGENTAQIINLTADTYGVTVEDAAGCTVETEVILNASDIFEVSVVATAANCLYDASGSIIIEEVLGGTGNLSYSFDGEFFNPIGSIPFTIPQQLAGVYTIFIQDENACLVEETVVVSPAEELVLDIIIEDIENNIIHLGDSISLEGEVNFTPAIIRWSPSENLSDWESLTTFAKPLVSTTYTLYVEDEAGCNTQQFVHVLVDRNTPIFIPNAFSPDGDGVNDILYINASISGIREIRSFFIYDRWGEIVFSAEHFLPNDPTYGWDGKLSGRTLNPAVFVYVAEVEFIDGRIEQVSGDLVLVR